jgi:hypothetical protein
MGDVTFNGVASSAAAIAAGALQNGALENGARMIKQIADTDAAGREQRGATAIGARNGGASSTSSAPSKGSDPGAIHMEKLKADLKDAIKSGDSSRVQEAQSAIDAITKKSSSSTSSADSSYTDGGATTAPADSSIRRARDDTMKKIQLQLDRDGDFNYPVSRSPSYFNQNN